MHIILCCHLKGMFIHWPNFVCQMAQTRFLLHLSAVKFSHLNIPGILMDSWNRQWKKCYSLTFQVSKYLVMVSHLVKFMSHQWLYNQCQKNKSSSLSGKIFMGKFLEIISGWSQIQSEVVEDKTVHLTMLSLFWCYMLTIKTN